MAAAGDAMTQTAVLSSVVQQRNFKQKFAALLKRFKVTDEVSDQRRSAGTRNQLTRSQICSVTLFYSVLTVDSNLQTGCPRGFKKY